MPSPLTFKIFDESVQEVKGYCNKRKDSLAMYKKGDGWDVIHKASGNSISSAISTSVTGYPKTLALIAHVQENAADSLRILDSMVIGETIKSPLQKEAARHIQQVIRDFNGK